MDVCTQGDFYNRAALKAGYYAHYAHVRALVPKERLLEFRAKDGWGPLCEFLGKEVPKGEYPAVNEARSVVGFHEMMWWSALWRALRRVGTWSAVVAVVVVIVVGSYA